MTNPRKPRRARCAMPGKPAPTENQIEEAMLAFERLKVRYRLEHYPEAPIDKRYCVRVVSEMVISADGRCATQDAAYQIVWFASEGTARFWREREIIREAITAGMRAKP